MIDISAVWWTCTATLPINLCFLLSGDAPPYRPSNTEAHHRPSMAMVAAVQGSGVFRPAYHAPRWCRFCGKLVPCHARVIQGELLSKNNQKLKHSALSILGERPANVMYEPSAYLPVASNMSTSLVATSAAFRDFSSLLMSHNIKLK